MKLGLFCKTGTETKGNIQMVIKILKSMFYCQMIVPKLWNSSFQKCVAKSVLNVRCILKRAIICLDSASNWLISADIQDIQAIAEASSDDQGSTTLTGVHWPLPGPGTC